MRTQAYLILRRESGLPFWKRATSSSSFDLFTPISESAWSNHRSSTFYDVGLASYLIGIESAKQVFTHPLRGALFENVVVAEALKHRFNRGLQPNLSFFRDAKGLECDLLYQTGQGIGAIEIKAGSTVSSDHFRSINRVADLIPEISAKALVYGGTTRQSRNECEVVPLAELGGMLARTEIDRELAVFMREKTGPIPATIRM